jgi:hypothetical protein
VGITGSLSTHRLTEAAGIIVHPDTGPDGAKFLSKTWKDIKRHALISMLSSALQHP